MWIDTNKYKHTHWKHIHTCIHTQTHIHTCCCSMHALTHRQANARHELFINSSHTFHECIMCVYIYINLSLVIQTQTVMCACVCVEGGTSVFISLLYINWNEHRHVHTIKCCTFFICTNEVLALISVLMKYITVISHGKWRYFRSNTLVRSCWVNLLYVIKKKMLGACTLLKDAYTFKTWA